MPESLNVEPLWKIRYRAWVIANRRYILTGGTTDIEQWMDTGDKLEALHRGEAIAPAILAAGGSVAVTVRYTWRDWSLCHLIRTWPADLE